MADFEHGKMDISEKKQMFDRFVRFWIYQAAAVIAILIFLALFNA